MSDAKPLMEQLANAAYGPHCLQVYENEDRQVNLYRAQAILRQAEEAIRARDAEIERHNVMHRFREKVWLGMEAERDAALAERDEARAEIAKLREELTEARNAATVWHGHARELAEEKLHTQALRQECDRLLAGRFQRDLDAALANLRQAEERVRALESGIISIYRTTDAPGVRALVAKVCDEEIDRSGAFLGVVRKRAALAAGKEGE